MIAPQHDDRVVGEPFFVERIQQSPDLRVGVADAGVVAVTQRLRELGGDRIARRHTRVRMDLAVRVAREFRRALRKSIGRGERNLIRVVEIPVLLRRDERQMRLQETDGQKERLLLRLQLVQSLHRLLRRETIGEFVVELRANLKRRTFDSLALRDALV